MELLEALEAMLAQNSCICHAAGMPAVEPAFQIELFQIRVISTNRQLKFIRGRRKIKHSDAGEIGAPLVVFSSPWCKAEIPPLLEAGMLFPSPLSVPGLVFAPAEHLQVLPKAL